MDILCDLSTQGVETEIQRVNTGDIEREDTRHAVMPSYHHIPLFQLMKSVFIEPKVLQSLE